MILVIFTNIGINQFIFIDFNFIYPGVIFCELISNRMDEGSFK